MDMNNKHSAVIGVGVLVLVFGVLVIWYMALHPAPVAYAPSNTTATTTNATTTPNSLKITDNGKYYEIEAKYPSNTPLKESVSKEADAKAVMLMKVFEENTIGGFKENGNFENLTAEDIKTQGLTAERKYAMGIDYEIYKGERTVSYVYTIYQDTLGAHPNTYYRTFTFDMVTGNMLALDDLFLPTASYLDRMSEQTRKDLPKLLEKMGGANPDLDSIKSGTLPDSDSFQNFTIDGTNLNMIFPPYQVAAYVYGTIVDPIPLSSLADILKPIYLP
jgi:hypothetical protein